jgi:hypothetical protein
MTSQAPIKITIVLETYRDWRDWFASIKKVAKSRRILHLIDPDLNKAPIQLIEPLQLTYLDVQRECLTFADLIKLNKKAFKVMFSEYQLKHNNFKRISKALIDLSDLIDSTVARPLRIHYAECDTLYDILKALKLQLAVADSILKQELLKIYSSLKKALRS